MRREGIARDGARLRRPHRQVGVKQPDALDVSDAQEREAVFMLQASELALD